MHSVDEYLLSRAAVFRKLNRLLTVVPVIPEPDVAQDSNPWHSMQRCGS